MLKLTKGVTVRIERDEAKYPSRGTWPQFRGRTGTIVEVNRAGGGPVEYGVTFRKVRTPNAKGSIAGEDTTWFKSYELRALGGDVA